MKNRSFSNARRNHKLKGVKINLCVKIVLFLNFFQKNNFKVGGSARFLGGTGGKIGLNVEKWSFYQGLSRKFSSLSLAHKNTLFYTFSDQIPSPQSSKSTKKVKKLYFWTNFKQFPYFLPSPSPYFGAKFQILLCPPVRSLSKLG